MPLPLDELFAELATHSYKDERPWGYARVIDAPRTGMTVKYLHVAAGHRTSLQYHAYKKELIFIVSNEDGGFLDLDGEIHAEPGDVIYIRPGVHHRVTGPLSYLEISTYDDNHDTIRIEDDYGR